MGRTVFAVFALMLAILLVGGFCIGQRVEQLESASNTLSLPIPEAAALVGQPDVSDDQLAQLAFATRQSGAAASSPVLNIPDTLAVATATPDLVPTPLSSAQPTRLSLAIHDSETHPQRAALNSPVQTIRPLLFSRMPVTDIEVALLIKLDSVVNLDLEPPSIRAELGNLPIPSNKADHDPL